MSGFQIYFVTVIILNMKEYSLLLLQSVLQKNSHHYPNCRQTMLICIQQLNISLTKALDMQRANNTQD